MARETGRSNFCLQNVDRVAFSPLFLVLVSLEMWQECRLGVAGFCGHCILICPSWYLFSGDVGSIYEISWLWVILWSDNCSLTLGSHYAQVVLIISASGSLFCIMRSLDFSKLGCALEYPGCMLKIQFPIFLQTCWFKSSKEGTPGICLLTCSLVETQESVF